MLQRATDDCAAHGMAPHDPRCDPGHVIDAARQADSDLVDTSRFMDAYAASLRSAIVTGVEVCCSIMDNTESHLKPSRLAAWHRHVRVMGL